jgi:hypothetical protein
MQTNETIKEERISFKTAKLAKIQGFNGFYHAEYYDAQGREWMGFSSNLADYEDKVTKCSQGILQTWLRNRHKLHVRVDNVNVPDIGRWFFEIQKLPAGIIKLWKTGDKTYASYEEALERGLYEALKTIK